MSTFSTKGTSTTLPGGGLKDPDRQRRHRIGDSGVSELESTSMIGCRRCTSGLSSTYQQLDTVKKIYIQLFENSGYGGDEKRRLNRTKGTKVGLVVRGGVRSDINGYDSTR